MTLENEFQGNKPSYSPKLERYLCPVGDERRKLFDDCFNRLDKVMKAWDYFLPTERTTFRKGENNRIGD